MNLSEYFENTEGMGILSTRRPPGQCRQPPSTPPRIVMDETTIAFIMRPRRSYQNIQANPKAAYMFIEKGPGYQGRRLYLEKCGEETDTEKVNLLRRSSPRLTKRRSPG